MSSFTFLGVIFSFLFSLTFFISLKSKYGSNREEGTMIIFAYKLQVNKKLQYIFSKNWPDFLLCQSVVLSQNEAELCFIRIEEISRDW